MSCFHRRGNGAGVSRSPYLKLGSTSSIIKNKKEEGVVDISRGDLSSAAYLNSLSCSSISILRLRVKYVGISCLACSIICNDR